VVRLSGRCDADDFIGKLAFRHRARYQRYFERLRDGQPIKSPENWRRIGDTQPAVFELKVDKYRVYLLKHGQFWYVTHGRAKPKDRQVAAEAKKCIDIFWEGPQ
jgi:hypothetical protein